jgi:hypothetical protein
MPLAEDIFKVVEDIQNKWQNLDLISTVYDL